MPLVIAEGRVHEQILDGTYPLWSDGLSPERYRRLNDAQMRTPWGSRHLARLALVEGDRLLASAKRYELTAVLDGSVVPAVGIGAVFTPPEVRGRGHASAIVNAILDGAREAGAGVALLFSEIGPAFYQRLGFVPVPVAASALTVRGGAGAPAIAMRTASEADLAFLPEIHHRRAQGFRFSLRYDPGWLQYSIAKRRLLAGLGRPGARHFEVLVVEEGGRPVAWIMLHVERAGGGPERWTVESCGDRDPSGARVGAMLQALLARAPASPPSQIAAWWPAGFHPPQLAHRPLGASPVVMMMRPLAAGALAVPLGAADVLYWHADAF